MDLWLILLLVFAIVILVGAGFVALRRRQRSGSVLAAPTDRLDRGDRS